MQTYMFCIEENLLTIKTVVTICSIIYFSEKDTNYTAFHGKAVIIR